MHNNVIIGLAVLTAFTLSIMLALYGMRLLDRDRQWRPRRYGISAREVACSFCGKLVRAEAIMCRHCHHRLDEVVESQENEEITGGGVLDSVGPRHSLDKRLAAAASASEIVGEDLSKNQAFAWLDSAFAQLAVREAPAVWGAALADRAVAQQSLSVGPDTKGAESAQDDSARKNEVVVRTIGPVSRQPVLNAPSTKNWFSGWQPRREWAFAAGIASVAVIVGGSTFLVGPSKSRVAKVDDYVTFDVSERAPLYTGPEGKAEPAAAQPTEASGPAMAAGPAKAETGTVVKPETVAKAESRSESMMAAKSEPAAAPSKPAVPAIALPEMPQAPAVEKAPEPTVSLAAITPSHSAAKSDPLAAAAPPREEDWASLVSRAVKPAHSKDLIVAVQRLIRAEGYDPGTIDGTVGPRTRQAIRAYQRNGGLRPTGEIDRDLLTKLNLADRTVRVVGPLSGVAPPPVRTASTKPASTKPAVEWTK
jgi:hypothetical protein